MIGEAVRLRTATAILVGLSGRPFQPSNADVLRAGSLAGDTIRGSVAAIPRFRSAILIVLTSGQMRSLVASCRLKSLALCSRA